MPFSTHSTWPACHQFSLTKICKPATRTKTIDLETMASADMAPVVDAILPGASSELKALIIEQRHQLFAKGRCGHRWSQSLITTCRSLWIRSPQADQDLLDTGLIILPSRSILKLYKSDVQQDAGFHPTIFNWVRLEALRRNLSPAAYHGGILMDEMSIQEDLQAVRSGQGMRLIGFVDQGSESAQLSTSRTGTMDKELANHVLLMQFVGFNGFRFPFAHFPTRQATATDLFIHFWKAVSMLQSYGFHTDYINIDGAITNRQFVNMHAAADQPHPFIHPHIARQSIQNRHCYHGRETYHQKD